MITTVVTLHCDLCKLKKENVIVPGGVGMPDGWGTIKATLRNGMNNRPAVDKSPEKFEAVCPTCMKRAVKKLTELSQQNQN